MSQLCLGVPRAWRCSGEPAALLGTTLHFAFLLPVTYDSLSIQSLEFTSCDRTKMSYGQGSRNSHKQQFTNFMLPTEILKAWGSGDGMWSFSLFGAISFNPAFLMTEGSCLPQGPSAACRKRARVSVSLRSLDHQTHRYKLSCHGPAQQGFTL